MKVAVTSQDFRTVTGHAGHARGFLIFDAEPGREPVEIEQLSLPKDMVIHEFRGKGAHPIDGVEVLLSAGFGAGFAQHMAMRGITAVRTDETIPAEAVKAFLMRWTAGLEIATDPNCDCGHNHDHAHGHAHAHDHHHDHAQHDCGCSAAEMNENNNRLDEANTTGEKRNE